MPWIAKDGYTLDPLERIARQKLHHCKLFDFVDEKDKLIDSIINSKANKLNSASDIVNVLKEKNQKYIKTWKMLMLILKRMEVVLE